MGETHTDSRTPPIRLPEENDAIYQEGLKEAVALLHRLAGEKGFWASTVAQANYRRVWGRDSLITGLAALPLGEEALNEAFKQSLRTLARHQGPHGEIPSNVDPETHEVSYGGTAGRVDANLWFLVAAGEYWGHTKDDALLEELGEAMERVWFLLGAWEFNNRGLLYVPETGDWADEYLHEGYILYDQALYHQAGCVMHAKRRFLEEEEGAEQLLPKLRTLRDMIDSNYWFGDDEEGMKGIYHQQLYNKSKEAYEYCHNRFWLPFFTPRGYGYRFDALANTLVSLLGLSCDFRADRVDDYIMEEIWEGSPSLLPAFHPVVCPRDDNWKDLRMTSSFSFKNRPHEYHNGGLWPMIAGFHVADLAKRGKTDLARQVLGALHRANAAPHEGTPWSFPEYLHGLTGEPGGTPYLGWSAAAAVMGHFALEGRHLFNTPAPYEYT
ncbi:MAG: amylo-alpha-1,6-glucosidase [Opitutales bacterium]